MIKYSISNKKFQFLGKENLGNFLFVLSVNSTNFANFLGNVSQFLHPKIEKIKPGCDEIII